MLGTPKVQKYGHWERNSANVRHIIHTLLLAVAVGVGAEPVVCADDTAMHEACMNSGAALRREKWHKEHGENIRNSSFTERVYRNPKVDKKHKTDRTYDWLGLIEPTDEELAQMEEEQKDESSAIASAGESLTATIFSEEMEAIWQREAEEEKARYEKYEAEEAAAKSAGIPFISSESSIETNRKGGIPNAEYGCEGHTDWRNKMMHNPDQGNTGNWDTDNQRPFKDLGQPR